MSEGKGLLARTLSAGKAANACLGELDSEDAAPTGQLVEELLREAEDLHSQLMHGSAGGQVQQPCSH